MGRSVSVNYAREKGRYGAFTGSILIHTVPGIGINNDPTSAIFENNLPAGFLRCDGSVKNVKEYYALAQILGIGDDCRFKKETTTLRNANLQINDLGSFQLPDLGSKVILASRASGEYQNTTRESAPNINRVGVETTASSNVGDNITMNYTSNDAGGPRFLIEPQSGINMSGSVKFNMPSKTEPTTLTIEDFQAHSHNSVGTATGGLKVLNFSATHQTGGMGKGEDAYGANATAGNTLDETQTNALSGEASHQHRITKPVTYTQNPFTYAFDEFPASMEEVSSSISVKTENIKVLNQVVTPFMLVEYIIKF